MDSQKSSSLEFTRKRTQEQRRHPRYVYDAPVSYRQLGPDNTGRTRNLSGGGLMVELPELFSPKTQLALLLSLGEVSIRAEAEVVWSRESPPEQASPHDATTSYPHGLKFTRLDLQDRLNLELFIAKAFGG